MFQLSPSHPSHDRVKGMHARRPPDPGNHRFHPSTLTISQSKTCISTWREETPTLIAQAPSFILVRASHSYSKTMMKQSKPTSGLYIPLLLLRHHPELFDCGVAYMVVFPINASKVVVFNPDMVAQLTQDIYCPNMR
jgi:hypothetical protein